MKHFAIFLVSLLFTFQFSCDKAARPYAGPMEGNHPWLVFDPAMGQGIGIPAADLKDPNIIYFVFAMRNGNAVKINLETKTITPYHFNVANWEDFQKLTKKFELGYSYEDSGGPAWIEFRGKKEERVLKQMYGDPVPNRLGTANAILRTGYYYIMDNRGGTPFELLRTKISNSELDFGGLGSTYISPNGKWLVFVLDNYLARIFVFNRDENITSIFQTDHDDQTIEVWKKWGAATMGAKP
jgi:hypothetical protein